jgi:hypothetical protein
MDDKDDIEDVPILLCGDVTHLPDSLEAKCADCDIRIVYSPDPDVPENAVKLCIPCGLKRMEESDEVPEIMITKKNKEYLDRRGFRLKTEGSC